MQLKHLADILWPLEASAAAGTLSSLLCLKSNSVNIKIKIDCKGLEIEGMRL